MCRMKDSLLTEIVPGLEHVDNLGIADPSSNLIENDIILYFVVFNKRLFSMDQVFIFINKVLLLLLFTQRKLCCQSYGMLIIKYTLRSSAYKR